MKKSVVEIVSQEMNKIYKWWKHQRNENISDGNREEMDKTHEKELKNAYLCILDSLFWFTKKLASSTR